MARNAFPEVNHRMLQAFEVRPHDLVLGGKVLAVHRRVAQGVGAVVVIETDDAEPQQWLPESFVAVLDQARYRKSYLPAYSPQLGEDCTCGHEAEPEHNEEGVCRADGCRCLDYTPDR